MIGSRRWLLLGGLAGCAHGPRPPAEALPERLSAPLFRESTAEVGLADTAARHWGAAWGDVDGDGDLDLFTNNHASPPSLFLNSGSGQFGPDEGWLAGMEGVDCDCHGAAFIDVENDGLLDLFETAGRGPSQVAPHHLWSNLGGILLDLAGPLKISEPGARGRSTLWLDVNNDRLLDTLVINHPDPNGEWLPALYLRTPDAYWRVPSPKYFNPPEDIRGATLVEIDGEPGVAISAGAALHLYRRQKHTLARESRWDELFMTGQHGVIAEDFDGDGVQDILVLRGYGRGRSGLHVDESGSVFVSMSRNGGAQSLLFEAKDPVRIDLTLHARERSVAIAAGGAEKVVPVDGSLVLDESLVQSGALAPAIDGSRASLILEVTREESLWKIAFAKGGANGIGMQLQSEGRIREPRIDGWKGHGGEAVYLAGGSELDTASAVGLALPGECGLHVLPGDFDNDMDLDLLALCTEPTRGRPHQLYRNDGAGHFEPVAGHGAEGSGAIGAMGMAMADFDVDGALDVVVLPGHITPPSGVYPLEFYRGIATGNHWLELELEGTQSNRMGIGAKVEVEAGGRTQLRWERAGLHGYSQDSARLHVGLGGNAAASRVTVRWPSGVVQVLEDVPADQLLRVVEP